MQLHKELPHYKVSGRVLVSYVGRGAYFFSISYSVVMMKMNVSECIFKGIYYHANFHKSTMNI